MSNTTPSKSGPLGSVGPLPLFYILLVIWLLLDVVSKQWALDILRPVQSIPVIPGFFQFTFSQNTGAAFGMMSNNPQLLPIVVGVLLVWLIWMARQLDWTRPVINAATALVAAGALGNILDRIRHGYVVDFIDFEFFGWHYWTFNIADTGICVGLVLLVIFEWRASGNAVAQEN